MSDVIPRRAHENSMDGLKHQRRGERGLSLAGRDERWLAPSRRAERGLSLGRRAERGLSLSVWTAVALPAFIVAAGLGVDFSGHAAAEQSARSIAGQAARAGSSEVELTSNGVRLNASSAKRTAQRFVEAAGYSAAVSLPGGASVEVRASGAYKTRFLGLIGIHSLAFDATSTARAVTVLDGVGR